MDANAFAFFAAVVDAGSFASAARKLRVDRSNISRRIREIERDAGAQLLARTTRSMRLTDAGTLLYERAVAINAQIIEANQAVLSLRSEVRGPLHVSCAPLILRMHFKDLFWSFCHEYPEVSLSLTLRNDVVDFVRESVDVALRVTNDLGPTVVAREVGRVRWDLCASPEYLRRHGTPRVPQDLEHHAWLGVRNKTPLEFARGRETWRVTPFSRIECVDYSILREAALAGLGIGFVPSYATYEDFARRRLRPMLTEFEALPSLGTRLYAVTPQSRYMASQVRCFLDFLSARLQSAPSWQSADPLKSNEAAGRRASRGRASAK